MDKEKVEAEVRSTLPKRYQHLKCGEDMGRCMECGAPLEGREARRTVPEPCDECVKAKMNKMVVDGKEVDIPGGYGSKFIDSVRGAE